MKTLEKTWSARGVFKCTLRSAFKRVREGTHNVKKAQITSPTAVFILVLGLLLIAFILSVPPDYRLLILG
jgi:hypothetical protein